MCRAAAGGQPVLGALAVRATLPDHLRSSHMPRARTVRLAGFVGALCASAALVGFSVTGTGAYFTDSHNGSINASTGHIKVDVSDGTLNFDNLLPGEYQTDRINYVAHPSGGTEDIWLVFPNAGSSSDAFIHTPQAGPTPLGRYGHFGVTSTGGASFVSSNLTLSPSGYDSADSCSIDANGEGGSAQTATDPSDHAVPYCAPMKAILLQSGLSDGQAGNADLTFGFTKILTAPQDAASALVESFKIVATQHGIRPDDPSNG
jgi:hypothetical protein